MASTSISVASQLRLGRVKCWNIRFLRDLRSPFAGVFQRDGIVRVYDVFDELRYTFDFPEDATGASERNARLSLWPVNLQNRLPLDAFLELRPWFEDDEANSASFPAPAQGNDALYYLVAYHSHGQSCVMQAHQSVQKHLEGIYLLCVCRHCRM